MKQTFVLISFLWVLSIGSVYAVVAMPGSGVVGDEFFHYREGEVPPPRPSEAELEARRRLPGLPYGAFPTKGQVRGLVILVNFSDVQYVTPNANDAFTRMLNESGYSENYGTGSARDYFIASSDSVFMPQFDVYGPYTLSHEMAYYGGNSSQHDQRPAEMVEEGCRLAEDDGVDFALYDTDNDGYVDNVFVYYAGYNEAEGGPATSIWPHRSRIIYSGVFGGKWLSDYACTSELTGNRGSTMCGIGTFCHEFSHVLGLPDMYNTENSSVYTVGGWDIMSSGNYNNHGHTPPTYTAFERFMLGWLKPEQLVTPSDYVLTPLETGNSAYLIAKESHSLNPQNLYPAEFWMVENRQRVGWDSPEGALPGVGLLITHITHSASAWRNNTYNNRKPLGFDVCEAYSRNPNSSSASDTYPGSMNIITFVPTDNKEEQLFSHTINSIRYMDATQMAFHYGESAGVGFSLEPKSLPTILTEYTDVGLQYYPEELTIHGQRLGGRSVILSMNNAAFQVSVDGKEWYRQMEDSLTADSTYLKTVYIRHTPSKQCAAMSAVLTITAGDNMAQTQLQLRGYSQRALMIQPVETEKAEDVTPYTFVAKWQAEKDAEFYYLTLWRLADGSTAILPELALTSFAHEGEFAETEIFPTGVQELRVNVGHSYLGEETNGGQLVIDGGSGTWEKVDSITLRPISPEKEYVYTFEDGKYDRFRFRYHHLGGSGFIRLKECKIALNREVEAVYSGEEYMLYAPTTQAQIAGLNPDTEYSYQLKAVEEKGCERHETALGKATAVKTLVGAKDPKKNVTIYVTEDKRVMVYLPVVSQEGYQLMLYSVDGHRIDEVAVPAGVYQVEVPTDALVSRGIYLIQYAKAGALSRSGFWGKFVY